MGGKLAKSTRVRATLLKKKKKKKKTNHASLCKSACYSLPLEWYLTQTLTNVYQPWGVMLLQNSHTLIQRKNIKHKCSRCRNGPSYGAMLMPDTCAICKLVFKCAQVQIFRFMRRPVVRYTTLMQFWSNLVEVDQTQIVGIHSTCLPSFLTTNVNDRCVHLVRRFSLPSA